MKRKYIAALVVFTPVLGVSILKYYFPLSYQMLSGYMIAVAIVFKTALMTFFSASKLKFISFLKGLTIIQGAILLIKRWFLDNVFAKWLQRNITDHIMVGIADLLGYYRALNLKAKFRNIFLPLIITIISAWALYATGQLDNLLLFTELKVVIIAISKTIVTYGVKIFGFMVNSWITPILEVFALSYIFSWLERVLGSQNPLIRLLDWIGGRLNRLIFFFTKFNKKHIDPLINDKVSKQSIGVSNRISDYIKRKKISYEYEQFDKLEQRILKGHIDAYHSFKGMEKIKDKKELYFIINKKTDDNLDIVAFVSRNKKGDLLPQSAIDSFYNDIFILESIASSHRHGVKEELSTDPDHSDFWVLNTSTHPATLASHSGFVPTQHILPQSIQLIKTDTPQDYAMGDIYFEYKGRSEAIVAIEPVK